MWRQRLQRAYNRPEYDEALAALQSLQHELEDRNQSAAGSLAEGLDETLTLHRLGVYGVLGRSLKTTNGLESFNALIEERCAKVDHWQNSSQRQRRLATALLDIEPRLRKVMGYRHLPRLRDALKRELKIDTTTSKTKSRVSNQESRRVSTRNGLDSLSRFGFRERFQDVAWHRCWRGRPIGVGDSSGSGDCPERPGHPRLGHGPWIDPDSIPGSELWPRRPPVSARPAHRGG